MYIKKQTLIWFFAFVLCTAVLIIVLFSAYFYEHRQRFRRGIVKNDDNKATGFWRPFVNQAFSMALFLDAYSYFDLLLCITSISTLRSTEILLNFSELVSTSSVGLTFQSATRFNIIWNIHFVPILFWFKCGFQVMLKLTRFIIDWFTSYYHI